MKYYRIRHTLNTRLLGHYPQVKDIKHNCNVLDEPRFIEHVKYEKINFKPIVSNPILYSKSKKTDLIESLGIGFSLKLLVSSKLKNLLGKDTQGGFQYFQCSIFHKDIEHMNYWILNPYEVNQEFIDFEKSEIQLRSRKPEGGTKLTSLSIASLEDFNRNVEFHKSNNSLISIVKIVLGETINKDFFALRNVEGGLGYFVSEKLKMEIEDADCSGIEFQPICLTFNEWVVNGGEREKIYGKSLLLDLT